MTIQLYKTLTSERMLTPILLLVTSILFSTLLYRVYPITLVFPDTYEYFMQGKDFFRPQNMIVDHARMPLYSVLMYSATLSTHTSALHFWFHAALFSTNILLAYRISRTTWGSTRIAFICALMLILMEVHVMRTFFYSVVGLTEALSSHLIFASTLILADSVMRKSRMQIVGACALAGITCVVRPLVFALIPFGAAAVVLFLQKEKKQWLLCILCIVFLMGPQSAWKLRNFVVYGKLLPNPYAAIHLTTHAVPLIQEGDEVFGDPEIDAAFYRAVTTVQLPPDRNALSPFWNPPGTYWGVVMGFYASMTDFFKVNGNDPLIDRDAYGFQTTDMAMRAAKKLILQHPVEYAHNVVINYLHLMDLNSMDNYTLSFQEHPRDMYIRLMNINKKLNLLFFDGTSINTDWTNSLAARMLELISAPARHDGARPLNIHIIMFPHFLFLIGLILYWKNRKNMNLQNTQLREGLLMIILFSVLSLQFITIALVTHLTDRRYGISVSMLLNFFWIAGIITIARYSYSSLKNFFRHDKEEWYTQTLV